MVKLLRSVRSEAMDAGVKFAIANHKDLLCWETRQLIEGGQGIRQSGFRAGGPALHRRDVGTAGRHRLQRGPFLGVDLRHSEAIHMSGKPSAAKVQTDRHTGLAVRNAFGPPEECGSRF